MGYIGSDPKTKESVSTSQLINDSVTNEKIVDDILFTSVTSSIVSASHITASSYQGGFDTGTSTRISGSLGANATTIRNLTSAGITGSFSPSSASFSTRTTTLEVASGSLSTRVTTNESDLTTLKGSGTVQGVSTGNTPTFAGVTVTGTLTAQEIHTEFESASIIFSSGSTIFGDTADDIHQMTGSLRISGSSVGEHYIIGNNVGIGTDNPATTLDVNGSALVGRDRDIGSYASDDFDLMVTNANNDATAILLYNDAGAYQSSLIEYYQNKLSIGLNNSNSDDDILAKTSINITSTGVGIGTNNPRYPLVVSGSGQNSYIHFPQDNNSTSDGLVVGFASEGNAYIWNYENSFLIFGANNSVRMKLNTDSNISLSNNDSGTSNTVFGKNAGDNIDAGSNYNTFIGEGVADASMNDATDNVGVGYQALSALTTGDDNVAVGMRALLDLEGGNKNTGLGDSAGRSITSGEENVMVGYQAGDGITSGGANCIVGVNAAGAGNADYITAIGREAARDLNSTDANGTTAVGTNAIAALTSGQANTAVGFQTLKDCDVGDFNTAVGYQALKDFDPGSDGHGSNTAVGYRAGYSVSTAENNTMMGARAGEATTGANNTIIGREAALNGTSINHCVIIGASAGSNASMTGDTNVFIGSAAGDANTNGTNNIVIGGGSDGGATQDYQITIGSQFNNDGDDNSIQFVNGALSRRLSYDLDSGNATITSDERTKEDITDYQIGLEFINKLKPKQFTKKKNADLPAEFFGEYTAHRNDTTKNPRVYQGMIAQEVSASMVEMGITPTHITGSSVSNPHFSGWEQSKESGEQRLSYVSFVTPLIQSVKELTDEIRFLRGAITGSTDLNQLKALVSGSQFV